MRLREIRPQPLLETPGDADRWRIISPSDERAFKEALREERKLHNGVRIGWMHYFMRELGMPEPIQPDDEKWMLGEMKRGRGGGYSKLYPAIILLMKKLGVKGADNPPTEKMSENLVADRLLGDGGMVLSTYFIMNELGVGAPLLPEDGKLILAELPSYRRGKDGLKTGQTHFYLRALNMGEEVTGEDRVNMQSGLNEARETGDGFEIAHMHFLIRLLLPHETYDPRQQMPPLKRFGK